MKCNACWRELEDRAVATICGHIFCIEDGRDLVPGSACPICEQILSKCHIKSLDLNPGEDWTNMVMAGIPPQNIMKSAFRGVVFWIGQKDVESRVTINTALQLKQKYKQMEAEYMQKLEQVHGAYQKAVRKIQDLEREKEALTKDIAELQEKYTDKSRQKRKLEEMYECLRNEYEKSKRNAASPRPPSARPYPALQQPTPLWQRSHQATNKPAAFAGALAGGFGAKQSPLKTADSDMFRPLPPTTNKPSNALRDLLLSPLKKPSQVFRSGR